MATTYSQKNFTFPIVPVYEVEIQVPIYNFDIEFTPTYVPTTEITT